MQVDRIAGSVRGLGVCDVWRIELQPIQHTALARELETRCDDPQDDRRALTRLRAQLPDAPERPFVLTGPAGLLGELVRACLRAVVTELDELEALAAWVATALDCRAVEAFCFEPGVDPR